MPIDNGGSTGVLPQNVGAQAAFGPRELLACGGNARRLYRYLQDEPAGSDTLARLVRRQIKDTGLTAHQYVHALHELMDAGLLEV